MKTKNKCEKWPPQFMQAQGDILKSGITQKVFAADLTPAMSLFNFQSHD